MAVEELTNKSNNLAEDNAKLSLQLKEVSDDIFLI